MKFITKMLCTTIDVLLYVLYAIVSGAVLCIGMILTILMIPFDMIGIPHE